VTISFHKICASLSMAARRAISLPPPRAGCLTAYVSKRIALLEDTLKVKLFHRTTRHVSVTNAEKLMLSWAQRYSTSMRQLDGALEETQTEIHGGLRIAASSASAKPRGAPALRIG